jgi:hypothetical protein
MGEAQRDGKPSPTATAQECNGHWQSLGTDKVQSLAPLPYINS